MKHLYFDESIHERGGFIIGAFVCGPDAEREVARAIVGAGMVPGVHEYKSSARMRDHPEQVALRNSLLRVLLGYRAGIIVVPSTHRASLGEEALRGLNQFARANGMFGQTRLAAYFDEGIFRSPAHAAALSEAHGVDRYCDIWPEQDSRRVLGIQLADLVAHTAATMLLESLGIVTKLVRLEPEPGYDDDPEINIGFEMWTHLRYLICLKGPVEEQDECYNGMLMEVGENGLYISPLCGPELQTAALGRFGQLYLGCIH